MRDRANNVLNVGEEVLYLENGTGTSWLVWGTVSGFTPKMFIIQPRNSQKSSVRRHPRSVVKPFRSSDGKTV